MMLGGLDLNGEGVGDNFTVSNSCRTKSCGFRIMRLTNLKKSERTLTSLLQRKVNLVTARKHEKHTNNVVFSAPATPHSN